MPTFDLKRKTKASAIIWDWNGTLLNDLSFCVETINILLKKRNLPLLSEEKYKEVFSFPVKDYYEKAGFDFSKEDFAIPAREFIDLYNAGVNGCQLHPPVFEVLGFFRAKQTRQFILSAMKQDMLEETVSHHNISGYFEKIAGLSDHYAVSKIEAGKQLLSESGLDGKTTLIIGDTLHDFEVAGELGTGCILIADGHQSKKRLLSPGVTVLDSIEELPGFLGKNY
jgi:phosphoglycolate phosphatase